MVVAKTSNGMIIGLSEENLKRLKKGKPILFNTKDKGYNFNFQIGIMSGETEESIAEELKKLTL